MLPESWHPGITAGLIVLMIGALAAGRFGADLVLMGVLAALVLLGVIAPADAVAGFGNPAVLTVGLLYVVSAGMRHTGATNLLSTRLLSGARSVAGAQARIALPVAAVSAFVNNTPIVAMFVPVLSGVARRSGLPVGKLFMPLSFASILGGTCTLIGTSTNVVVAGLLIDYDVLDEAGEAVRFGMFTLAWVGLPIALVGIGYMLLAGRALLPGDRGGGARSKDPREYTVSLRVGDSAAAAGQTVQQAGLRNLPGLFLSTIDRGEKSLVAEPDLVLRSGDVLTFVGDLESVVDLQQVRGLEPLREERSSYRADRRLIEAVVSNSSRFVGQTIRDSQLRTRYGAVVLGVHRLGHRLEGKIGDIVLRPGDTLLLEAGDEFNGRHLDSRDFLLVTERGGPAPRHERAWVASAILVLLVATITAGLLSPLAAAMVAAGGMILTRCCTGPQARTALDLQVLVTIAAAFGIGHAVETTQLAAQAAGVVTGLAESLGIYGLLGAVYVLTVLCSMTMTNNAAAVLMFPIALVVAGQAGLPVLPFAVAIAVAASCEFTTPIGYQTNLMVMGPGGYRWLDYAKFGGPLTVLCGAICVGLAPLFYG